MLGRTISHSMNMRPAVLLAILPLMFFPPVHGPERVCDLVIRNAAIYDGSGAAPLHGDVAINADTIAALGSLGDQRGRKEVDAHGLS
ncbi:MAG TPA: hypothetical protein VF514_15430, partial [Bacteroidota bacterium]